MSTKLDTLRAMLADGSFHHATYRDIGTIWEGLNIYRRDPNGCRGFTHALTFGRDDSDRVTAETMTQGTGVSVGAYGRG